MYLYTVLWQVPAQNRYHLHLRYSHTIYTCHLPLLNTGDRGRHHGGTVNTHHGQVPIRCHTSGSRGRGDGSGQLFLFHGRGSGVRPLPGGSAGPAHGLELPLAQEESHQADRPQPTTFITLLRHHLLSDLFHFIPHRLAPPLPPFQDHLHTASTAVLAPPPHLFLQQ